MVTSLAEVGVEPTRPLRAGDFKSPASAIPPLGLSGRLLYFVRFCKLFLWFVFGPDSGEMGIWSIVCVDLVGIGSECCGSGAYRKA